MTELLERAFQKTTAELTEAEQDSLARFLLQSNLHQFLNEETRFISAYNSDTQQAIQDAAEGENLNNYHSADQLFSKLGL